MDFSELGLSDQLIQALKYEKYDKPYPIQVKAIPAILAGKDVLALAPTGSGKTASYVLPILETLSRKAYIKSRNIPVLILVPTRELAVQVEEAVRVFNVFLKREVKVMAVYGGVSINPQMKHLYGTEILVATPGRLLDLLSQNAMDLSQVKILVVDEVDKLLNLGFKEEMDEILSALPHKRQNLLFSATTDEAVEKITTKLLQQPVTIEVQQDAPTPDLILQSAYLVSPEKKGPLLRHLIIQGEWQQVLVFTSSIRAADNLAGKLNKNGIQAIAFHGDKKPRCAYRGVKKVQVW